MMRDPKVNDKVAIAQSDWAGNEGGKRRKLCFRSLGRLASSVLQLLAKESFDSELIPKQTMSKRINSAS